MNWSIFFFVKGELFFSSVEQVKGTVSNLKYRHDFFIGVNCIIFSLNGGFRVYFDLYEADFPNKYFFA